MLGIYIINAILAVGITFILFSKKLPPTLNPSNNSKETQCEHLEWYEDKQIRVIKCTKCGKQAWIKENKDLFPK